MQRQDKRTLGIVRMLWLAQQPMFNHLSNIGEYYTGYELAAWCYRTFMESFPSMKEKLHLPYAMHYERAKELFYGN